MNTKAISKELSVAGSHVSISVLCPGPVKTNFDDVAGIEMQLNIPYEAYIIHVLVKFDEAEMYENEILIANEIII